MKGHVIARFGLQKERHTRKLNQEVHSRHKMSRTHSLPSCLQGTPNRLARFRCSDGRMDDYTVSCLCLALKTILTGTK